MTPPWHLRTPWLRSLVRTAPARGSLNISFGLRTPDDRDAELRRRVSSWLSSWPRWGLCSWPRTCCFTRTLPGDLVHVTRNLNRRFDQGYAMQRLPESASRRRRRARCPAASKHAPVCSWPSPAGRVSSCSTSRSGDARSARPPRLHGDGDDSGRTRRRLSRPVVLPLAELERVADYLVLISRGTLEMVGGSMICSCSSCRVSGPSLESDRYAVAVERRSRKLWRFANVSVVWCDRTSDPVPLGWEAHPLTLESN